MTPRKRTLGIIGLAMAMALATLTACPPPPPTGVVYVATGPPPIQGEIMIVSPGPDFVWVPGYWGWSGTAYVWTRGAWIRPPRARARWVSPRWWHSSRGWYRTGAVWQ